MKVKIKVVVRNIGAVIGWSINRVVKIFGNMLSLGICCVCPVHKNRVVCWSYDFKQYSCNPRYLTEYLLANNPEFDIYWVFRNKTDTSSLIPAQTLGGYIGTNVLGRSICNFGMVAWLLNGWNVMQRPNWASVMCRRLYGIPVPAT